MKIFSAALSIFISIFFLFSCSSPMTGTQALSWRGSSYTFDAAVTVEGAYYVISGECSDGAMTLKFSAPFSMKDCAMHLSKTGETTLEMPDGILLPIPRETLGGAACLFYLLTLDASSFLEGKRDGDFIAAKFGADVILYLDRGTLTPARLCVPGAVAEITNFSGVK